MKKIGFRRCAWLQRRCRRTHEHYVRHAGQRMHAVNRIRKPASFILLAPSFFTIQTMKKEQGVAAREFLAFLHQIRNYSGVKLCIDLQFVLQIQATAALLFKAEICYLRSRNVQIFGVAPKKERVRQVLTQTGICAILGLPLTAQIDREDTLHWTHASGVWTQVKPDALQALLLATASTPLSQSLYKGMIESVNNCIEHAYMEHPKRRSFDQKQEGWWGFQQIREGVLTTCICDLGIGIARALPIRLLSEVGVYNKVMAVARHLKGEDVKSILAAIEYGRSSTNLLQRGKGLRDAHSVIDAAGEGLFQIFSNSGFYSYTRTSGKDNAVTFTRRLQGSISGTMYVWRYPLRSGDHPDLIPDLGASS